MRPASIHARRHGYRERLMALAAVRQLAPGDVMVAHVLHADWCPIVRGATECTCEPEIVLDRAREKAS